MKNKEFRILMAVITLTGTLITGLAAGACPAYAAETSAASSATQETTAGKTTAGSKTSDTASTSADHNSGTKAASSAAPRKDETVYATIDGNGTVTSVTVSDQLKNISGITQVQDRSSLENIENVKGDETFSEKNGSLVWDTDGADICYQGTTSKELPVGVTVTYTLDGKKVTADQLAGKSGRLTIRYTYENKTGSSTEEMTPFLMATGVMLDSSHFQNVSVKNGKLISDGERDIAVGIGLPAVSELLGTDISEIPEYFEIEADVTDYEAVQGITVASNSVFQDINTGDFNSISDLTASMNQLQSASDQLVSGSGELRSGLDTLLSSSGTLTDGIDRLSDGSTALLQGAQSLDSGSEDLTNGLATASQKVSGELLPGIQALDAGVSRMQGTLEENLPVLGNGIQTLSDGISQTAYGTSALSAGLNQVGAGMSLLHSGINEAGAKSGELSAGMTGLTSGAADLAGALHAAAGMAGGTSYTALPDSWEEIAALQTLLDSGAITDEATANAVSGVIQSLSAKQSERDAAASADTGNLSGTLDALAASADALSANAGTLSAGAAALNTALTTGDGTPANPGLANAAGQLDAALNTGDGTNPGLVSAAGQINTALNGDSANGVSGILDGASALDQAVNGTGGLTEQVSAGVAQLKGGTSKLAAGVDGENGLAAGLNLLTAGSRQLSDGSGQLSSGAGELAAGIGTLKTGSGALIDGVKQLDDGAVQLNDGMIQFDRDGIQKLTDAFSGEIDELLNNVTGMFDTSKKYNNFSGIADGMDGEVKFVFVTK